MNAQEQIRAIHRRAVGLLADIDAVNNWTDDELRDTVTADHLAALRGHVDNAVGRSSVLLERLQALPALSWDGERADEDAAVSADRPSAFVGEFTGRDWEE